MIELTSYVSGNLIQQQHCINFDKLLQIPSITALHQKQLELSYPSLSYYVCNHIIAEKHPRFSRALLAGLALKKPPASFHSSISHKTLPPHNQPPPPYLTSLPRSRSNSPLLSPVSLLPIFASGASCTVFVFRAFFSHKLTTC